MNEKRSDQPRRLSDNHASSEGRGEWCSTTDAELAAIGNIDDAIHGKLSENPEIFEEKLRLFPEGCFVLIEDRAVVGYGFCHPWYLCDIPKLNHRLGRIPSDPQCMFIHDIAILPRGRGRGASGSLVELIASLATKRKLHHLALVAVHNSHPYWARLGFELAESPALAKKLATYGPDARYMVRALS